MAIEAEESRTAPRRRCGTLTYMDTRVENPARLPFEEDILDANNKINVDPARGVMVAMVLRKPVQIARGFAVGANGMYRTRRGKGTDRKRQNL